MGFKKSWKKSFFIFCQISFELFNDFSRPFGLEKSLKHYKSLKNHQIRQQNEEKPCSICVKNTFLHCTYFQKPKTRVWVSVTQPVTSSFTTSSWCGQPRTRRTPKRPTQPENEEALLLLVLHLLLLPSHLEAGGPKKSTTTATTATTRTRLWARLVRSSSTQK